MDKNLLVAKKLLTFAKQVLAWGDAPPKTLVKKQYTLEGKKFLLSVLDIGGQLEFTFVPPNGQPTAPKGISQKLANSLVQMNPHWDFYADDVAPLKQEEIKPLVQMLDKLCGPGKDV